MGELTQEELDMIMMTSAYDNAMPESQKYVPDPNMYGDPTESTPYESVQPTPYEIPSESLGPLAKQHGVEYIVPERKMDIIKENPWVAKTPASTDNTADFFSNPLKKGGLLDKGFGMVPGPFGWAWTVMRGANEFNNWWSKR